MSDRMILETLGAIILIFLLQKYYIGMLYKF